MGLKIAQFKKGGHTFVDAYAKVGNIKYDNDSKIAQFNIKIYPSKDDKNIIYEISNNWVRIVPDTDYIAQCYNKILISIAQIKSKIATQQALIDSITNDDNLKLKEEEILNGLKSMEILQLDGATEW